MNPFRKRLELGFIRAALIVVLCFIPSCYGGMGHDGMMGWGHGMGFGMILITLFWIAVIVGIVFLIVWLVRKGRR